MQKASVCFIQNIYHLHLHFTPIIPSSSMYFVLNFIFIYLFKNLSIYLSIDLSIVSWNDPISATLEQIQIKDMEVNRPNKMFMMQRNNSNKKMLTWKTQTLAWMIMFLVLSYLHSGECSRRHSGGIAATSHSRRFISCYHLAVMLHRKAHNTLARVLKS